MKTLKKSFIRNKTTKATKRTLRTKRTKATKRTILKKKLKKAVKKRIIKKPITKTSKRSFIKKKAFKKKAKIKKAIHKKSKIKWYYRIISFLASSSNITYIRTITIHPVKKHRVSINYMFKDIISDFDLKKENIISAYAHNRITHKHIELKRYGMEFVYIEEDKDSFIEYKKFRSELNRINKMKSYKIL